jgi:hypothetical protein
MTRRLGGRVSLTLAHEQPRTGVDIGQAFVDERDDAIDPGSTA